MTMGAHIDNNGLLSSEPVLDTIDDGILFTDADFRIVRTNRWITETFADRSR